MKILLLGDVMLGENLFHLNRGIASKYCKNYRDVISLLVRNLLFKDCDAIFFNMEYSLIDHPDISKLYPSSRVYRGDVDSLDFLDFNKTKIFNIANNHFSQHGKKSSIYTKNTLSAKGINYIGDSNDPFIFLKDKNKYSFWAYSTINDPSYCEEYNSISLENLASVNEGIKKGNNEFWAISLHWGDEYIGCPSSTQKEIAYKLVDNGFDLIIGHHPHVIQTVEKHKDSLIVYSLGNFISDHNFSKETTTGLAALVDTEKISKTKFYKTEQVDYIVVKANEINMASLNQQLNIDYNIALKRIHKKYIRKNKIEYLKNIHNTDYKIISNLIKKNILKLFG